MTMKQPISIKNNCLEISEVDDLDEDQSEDDENESTPLTD